MASFDHQIDHLLEMKGQSVRSDRRNRTAATVSRAASAAAIGDTKTVYAELRLLRPWKARQAPMITKLDGNMAKTAMEIAD